MNTLERQAELNNEVLPKLKGEERVETKKLLNYLIQSDMDIQRRLDVIDEEKTKFAIASNI